MSLLPRFGGIFEHSAWIAERAYDFGIGPANNTANGLHAALACQFRLANHDERLGVLNAHPDLAGKLAVAKQLYIRINRRTGKCRTGCYE